MQALTRDKEKILPAVGWSEVMVDGQKYVNPKKMASLKVMTGFSVIPHLLSQYC
jgi:hypothetical protein